MTLYALKPLDHVRFWSFVQTAGIDECWPWRGGTGDAGHGFFSLGGKLVIASRIAYQLTFGEIPDGLLVRHKCDNPPCCNGRHLLTGTTQDNTMDRGVRGRTNRGTGVWHKVRLSEEDVLRIRATPQPAWTRLAKELGVSRNTVFSAAIGHSWAHLPGAVTVHGREAHASLDEHKVRYIRTCGLSDAHLGRVFKTTAHTVYLARIGKTWTHIDTPPDTRRRSGGGSHDTNEARFNDGPLDSWRVAQIRTGGKPDRYWADLWRIDRKTIYRARVGQTFKDHPVPPDEPTPAHRGNWDAPIPTSTVTLPQEPR
jgi:hypothetical protein